jgi:hypothetical protein
MMGSALTDSDSHSLRMLHRLGRSWSMTGMELTTAPEVAATVQGSWRLVDQGKV